MADCDPEKAINNSASTGTIARILNLAFVFERNFVIIIIRFLIKDWLKLFVRSFTWIPIACDNSNS